MYGEKELEVNMCTYTYIITQGGNDIKTEWIFFKGVAKIVSFLIILSREILTNVHQG